MPAARGADRGDRRREHGMAICGGNGMGFLHLEPQLRATGFLTPDELPPGPVTFLSHSGSAFAAFAVQRPLASGSTCSCRAARRSSRRWTSTCRYALDLDSTKVVGAAARDRPRSGGVRRGAREGRRAGRAGGRAEGGPHGGRPSRWSSRTPGALAGEHGAFEARVRRVRRARVPRPRRDGRHARAVLEPAPGDGRDRHRVAPRLRRGARDVRRPRGRPRASRSRSSRTPRSRGSTPRSTPGSGGREPARRVGDRDRRRSHLRRELPRAPRRPGHRARSRSSST